MKHPHGGRSAGLMDLPGLIQNISAERRAGELTVRIADDVRRLRFLGGMITSISGSPTQLFIRVLGWSGLVTSGQMVALVADLPEGAGASELLYTLLDDELLDRNGVLDAIDYLIEEEVCTLLAWSQPEFAFSEDIQADAFADAQVALGVLVNPGSVLLEGLRRRDETARVAGLIPHVWDCLMRDPAVKLPDSLSEDSRLLLANWMDGLAGGVLLEHPLLPPFRATVAMVALRQCEAIRLASASELVTHAENAAALGQHRRALGWYQRALALGQDGQRIYQRIAVLNEKIGDRDAAGAAWLAVAQVQIDPSSALRALWSAIRLGANADNILPRLIVIGQQAPHRESAAQAMVELADVLEQKGEHESAIHVLREAKTLGGDGAVISLRMARLAERQQDKELAALEFEHAARAFHESDRLNEATEAWQNLVRLEPGRLDFAKEYAEISLWTGDREQGIAILRKALPAAKNPSEDLVVAVHEVLARLDPSDFAVHDYLAKAYERRRDRHGATEQLRLAAIAQDKSGEDLALTATLGRILELDPQRLDILTWLGDVRLRLHQPGLAGDVLVQAADVALAKGLRKEMRSILEGAIAKLPLDHRLRSRLAQILNRDGDQVAAIRELSRAADLTLCASDPVQTRDLLLQAYRLDPDDLSLGIRLVAVAIQIQDPLLDHYLGELIRLATRTGNLGIALEHASQRIALTPSYEARSEYIELLRRSGDPASELAAGQDLLAEVFAAGRFDLAVEILSRLVVSHPKNASLVLQLAEALGAQGDDRQSVRMYRHAVTLLQQEDRIQDAKDVVEHLAELSEDEAVLDLALQHLETGRPVDWERIRRELDQGTSLRLADEIAAENAARPGTGYHKVRHTDAKRISSTILSQDTP